VGFPERRAEQEERREAGTEILYKERSKEKTSKPHNNTTKHSIGTSKENQDSIHKPYTGGNKQNNDSFRYTLIEHKLTSDTEEDTDSKKIHISNNIVYRQQNTIHSKQKKRKNTATPRNNANITHDKGTSTVKYNQKSNLNKVLNEYNRNKPLRTWNRNINTKICKASDRERISIPIIPDKQQNYQV
jgi:hypothetical protein